MGVYVVTGGSGGIGGKTVEILRSQGHEVVNVDLKDSDICANLATKEGRDEVIHTIHAQYPDGIDGLCCNAGVSGACGNLKLMISLRRHQSGPRSVRSAQEKRRQLRGDLLQHHLPGRCPDGSGGYAQLQPDQTCQ